MSISEVGVVVNEMDVDIVVGEFELQSQYYVNFWERHEPTYCWKYKEVKVNILTIIGYLMPPPQGEEE